MSDTAKSAESGDSAPTFRGGRSGIDASYNDVRTVAMPQAFPPPRWPGGAARYVGLVDRVCMRTTSHSRRCS